MSLTKKYSEIAARIKGKIGARGCHFISRLALGFVVVLIMFACLAIKEALQ